MVSVPLEAGGEEVRAQCWGTGIVLGQADRFRSSLNFRLRATLVELERYGTVRVLLLREGADGQPVVENVTGALAVAAGHAPWERLEGVSLDTENFSREGRIGLRHNTGDEGRAAGQLPAPSDASAPDIVVDIGEQIATSSRLRSATQQESGQ